jgi:hypothetical protein
MFGRRAALVAAIGVPLAFGSSGARAGSIDEAMLVKALGTAQVSLEDGLRTSETVGTPISAKFEIAEGCLQLSVYAVAGDEYTEVVILPDTGVLMSAQRITDDEDLAAAAAQRKAMRDTTVALRAATESLTRKVPGSLAVSIVPELIAGRAVAKMIFLRAGILATAEENLR